MKNAAEKILRQFRSFLLLESASGLLLIACLAAALAVANSPWGDAWFRLLERPLGPPAGGGFAEAGALRMSLLHWINDGLMTIFFLLVGLEIKRELVAGELSGFKRAALPAIAASGGMLVPALIYLGFNHGTESARGWGIPMATDIAFALGALSLLGSRVPAGLKVFLAALAIIDDLGAVLVIAAFYTGNLSGLNLALAAGVFALLIGINRLGVRNTPAYLALGLLLWFFIHRSGVHGTIAGVLLAMTIPAVPKDDGEPPLERLERRLHPWTSFLILPLFALANAGIRVDAGLIGLLGRGESLGILCGLVLGKPIGIFLFTWASARFLGTPLPQAVSMKHIAGAGLLGGIGFTMSIFIAGLAFPGGELLALAKLGIFLASGCAALLGLAYLGLASPPSSTR